MSVRECVCHCVCLIFLASDWSEPWRRCTKFILYRLCTLVKALADQVTVTASVQYMSTVYWHECRHCSHQHSNKSNI